MKGKKLFTFLLIAVFMLSNTIGVIVVYQQIKFYHKQTIREQIKQNNFTQVIEILRFSKRDLRDNSIKIEFIEKNEFRFDGKLYDIISYWETDDSVFYKCINDTREEELEVLFVNYVVNNEHRQDLPVPIKQLLSSLQLEFFLVNKFMNSPFIHSSYFSVTSTDNPLDLCLIIPDPPPRS